VARTIAPERALALIRQASAERFPHSVAPGMPARRENLTSPGRSNVDLFSFYNVPEVRAISDRIASGVGRVYFRPALNVEGATGDKCPPLVDEEGMLAEGISPKLAADCAEIWSQVRSPTGGQASLFESIATCLTVAGDAWQFGYPGTPEMRWDPNGTPMWVGVARSAITEKNHEYLVEVGIDGVVKVPCDPEVDGHGCALRIWKQSPLRPAQASVWLTSCIRPIQILSAIYEAVAAVALSRLNAGLIIAPDDQDQLPVNSTSLLGDGTPKQFPLGTSLKQALYDEIGDHVEASQAEVDGWSRAVPAVIGLNSTIADKVKWLELARNMDPELGDRIDDLRARIFRTCPLPPEVSEGMANLSGLGGGNVAQQVDQSEYQRAILPVCETIAEANTLYVLRTGLLERNYSQLEVDRVQIGFSAKNLLMPPDRSDSAIKVASIDPTSTLLSGQEIRESTGLGDFAGPDDDEIQQARVLWLMGKSSDYRYLAPLVGLPEAPEPSVVEPTEVIDTVSIEAPEVEARVALPPVRQASAAPEGADTETGYRLVAIATSYEERLATLCESIIARMTERASARLTSLARTKPFAEVRDTILDATAPQLLGAVPQVADKLRAESVDDGDLFEPALASFAAQHETMTRKAQKAAVREVGGDWSVVEPEANEANAASWALLGTLLTQEARFRFEGRLPEPLAGEGALSPFGIPSSIIARTSAVAGGQIDAVAGGVNTRTAPTPWTTVSTGPVTNTAAASQGKVVAAYQWLYRPEIERTPFPEHEELDGLTSEEEDDFGGGWFVGDHAGCLCATAPIYVDVAL
jgi:hypothetical protein